MKKIIILIIGCILLLAGCFNWKIVLAVFTRGIPPQTNFELMVYRIVSIIAGISLIGVVAVK